MRPDVAADLEHDLGAVRKPELPGVAAPPHPVDEDAHPPVEGRESVRPERLSPGQEERCERRPPIEAHDAARIERPDATAAAGADDSAETEPRASHSDPGREDHDVPAREQLDVDALSVLQRRSPTGEVGPRRAGGGNIAVARTDRGRNSSGERDGGREEKRVHRRNGTGFAACLLVAAVLVAALGAGMARADGDPASDYLIGQKAFLSYDAKIPRASQQKLLRAVESANAQGFPVKVALIWTSYDLGSVPQLFRNPRYYARFLDTEDSYWLKTKTRLVVVMPNGLGFAQWKHDPSAGYRTLAGIKVSPTPSGMAKAATTAVVKLAAAAGIHVSTSGASSSSTTTDTQTGSGSGGRVEILVAVVAALALGVAARVLIRRRASRSALR
jgi:hypothetical protein